MSGKRWITRCRRQWLTYQITASLLYGTAAALLLAAVLSCLYPLPFWAYAVMGTILSVMLIYLSGAVRKDESAVAHMLDRRFPELEHSSVLLLKPTPSLGVLETLQVQRLHNAIAGLPPRRFAGFRMLFRPLGALAAALMLHALAAHYIAPLVTRGTAADRAVAMEPAAVRQPLPPAVSSAEIRIIPPAYTGLPRRLQHDLGIKAPAGATIELLVSTNHPVRQLVLLMDGRTETPLQRSASDSLQWKIALKPKKSGFYQLLLDGERSALYPLELTPDVPVSIHVSRPEQHTVIDFGFPEVVSLHASLEDDYGISHAKIRATVSTGKGEGVSFKSHELPLYAGTQRRTSTRVAREINLKQLGMGPGDELYFYISALDNAGQESRSDVFVVVLQDTAALFSMSGMTSGVDLLPEYFRSQRQIIMDTERLIAEMDTITEQDAQRRSNNLGIDQQLLRLRYGQFLGEEAEDAIGGHVGHDHGDEEKSALSPFPKEQIVSHGQVRSWKNHDPNHPGHESHAEQFQQPQPTEVPVDVNELIAAMSHQHDRAEDATFFDAEQKAHLKATLTEMWNTELRLRTYKPREALPYAYKALRLLKELQQKSRVYVGKAPTKTTPLKPEKRLTGDLNEIQGAVQRHPLAEEPDAAKLQRRLQRTLAYLSNLKTDQQLDENGRQLLIDAERSIAEAATREPSRYLNALKAIRLLEEQHGKNSPAEIRIVEQAIQQLLPALKEQPRKKGGAGKNDIYQLYFEQLTVK
jgi:hypothetical protein